LTLRIVILYGSICTSYLNSHNILLNTYSKQRAEKKAAAEAAKAAAKEAAAEKAAAGEFFGCCKIITAPT